MMGAFDASRRPDSSYLIEGTSKMTATLPISPLLALSRVDYLESSMLCIKVSTALAAARQGQDLDAPPISAFRDFLPEFLGLDTLEGVSPDSVLPVALLAIAPALRESGLVSATEANVSVYLNAITTLDQHLEEVISGSLTDKALLAQIEHFSRSLSNHMTTAVEQAIREGQALPL